MAKKQSRKVSKSEKATSTPAATTSRRLTSSDFNPDYTAIKSDLRRIGILAGSFFTILILLAFFLR